MNRAAGPLVLIHGFTGQVDVWNDVRGELAGSFECHAIDLPGHGRNSRVSVDQALTFSTVSQKITQELSKLGLQRFSLWGYSLGGRIAMHVALSNPERVVNLILESTSPGLADPVERLARMQSDEELAERIESDGLERFVDYWTNLPLFASQKSLPQTRQALGRQLRLQGTAKGYAAALRAFSVGRQEPLHNRLRELTMPVLLIAGELDRKYREFGELMTGSIPNAQLRIIAGAGHAPHWERPVETASAVAEFMRTA